MVFDPKCPYGKVPEYVYVWWKHHKKDKINRGIDCIHHIDGNHQNNKWWNLEKLTDSKHGKAHAKLNRLRRLEKLVESLRGDSVSVIKKGAVK